MPSTKQIALFVIILAAITPLPYRWCFDSCSWYATPLLLPGLHWLTLHPAFFLSSRLYTLGLFTWGMFGVFAVLLFVLTRFFFNRRYLFFTTLAVLFALPPLLQGILSRIDIVRGVSSSIYSTSIAGETGKFFSLIFELLPNLQTIANDNVQISLGVIFYALYICSLVILAMRVSRLSRYLTISKYFRAIPLFMILLIIGIMTLEYTYAKQVVWSLISNVNSVDECFSKRIWNESSTSLRDKLPSNVSIPKEWNISPGGYQDTEFVCVTAYAIKMRDESICDDARLIQGYGLSEDCHEVYNNVAPGD